MIFGPEQNKWQMLQELMIHNGGGGESNKNVSVNVNTKCDDNCLNIIFMYTMTLHLLYT